MKLSELKDGRRYRLTRDVKNPRIDRRATDDMTRLPWSAGDVWRAKLSNGALYSRSDSITVELTPVHCAKATRGPSQYERLLLGWVSPKLGDIYATVPLRGDKEDEGTMAKEMLGALEELPESFPDQLHRIFAPGASQVDSTAYDILQWLVERGTVTEAVLLEAKAALDAQYINPKDESRST